MTEKTTPEQLQLITKIEAYLKYNDHIGDDDSVDIELARLSSHPKSAYDDIDKATKTLIDSSDILDEKILSSLPYTRIAQSCHFKGPESIELMSRSIDCLKSSNKVNVKSMSHDVFLSEPEALHWKKRKNTPQKFVERYSANILSQVPLVNGMDGRAINNISELYQAVKKYKLITGLIEKHLRKEGHILRKLLHEFEAYFVSRYEKHISLVQDAQATTDLQQFIIVMYEAIDQFYCLDHLTLGKQLGNETLFNRNNMINFVTSLVFTPKIYQTLLNVYTLQSIKQEETYIRNLEYCDTLKPQDFGVSPDYCLNEETIKALTKPFELDNHSLNSLCLIDGNANNSIDLGVDSVIKETEEASDNMTEPQKNISSAPKNEIHLLREEEEHFAPYETAIATLKNLVNKNSPVQKLKTILQVAEMINQSIEKFYKKQGKKFEEKPNGDETFAIFMYIVAKSQISNLTTHCKIIEKFSTSNILSSMSGYYLMTLKACVSYICTMDLPKEFTTEQFGASVKEYKDLLEKNMLDQKTENECNE